LNKILVISILAVILLSVSFTSISALTPENEQKLNDKIKSLEKKIKNLFAENTKLKTENTKLKTEKLKTDTVKAKAENSQPKPIRDAWTQVIVLSSSTSKKTDTFKISGEKWRFTWSCKAENEYDIVNITVYKPTSDVPIEFLLMQKCPPTEETTYVYKGTGEYYFDVMSGNISGWTIKVEEFLK
jgi:regulator of replication initiation timing